MTRYFRLAVVAAMILSTSFAVAQQGGAPGPAEDTAEVMDDPVPGPPPPLPDLSDPNGRSGESLAEPGSESTIPKSLRSSASKAGGPANDLNQGGNAPEAPLAANSVTDAVTGRDLFHGNYCGTGQRGEGLAPTDALDAACMRHDACYDAAGYRSCACDATLRREAARVSERPTISAQVRSRALSVAQAADVMSCKSP